MLNLRKVILLPRLLFVLTVDDNGKKCAAGCLIADDEYNLTMEANNWLGLVVKGLVPNDHFVIISDLQAIHDCNPPEDWKDLLENFAKQNNLIY